MNSCKKQSFNLCAKVAATKVLRGMKGRCYHWQYFAQRASVEAYTSGIFRGASINWKPVDAKKLVNDVSVGLPVRPYLETIREGLSNKSLRLSWPIF